MTHVLIFWIEVEEGCIELAVFLYMNKSCQIDEIMREQDSLAIAMRRVTGSQGEEKEMSRSEEFPSYSVHPSPHWLTSNIGSYLVLKHLAWKYYPPASTHINFPFKLALSSLLLSPHYIAVNKDDGSILAPWLSYVHLCSLWVCSSTQEWNAKLGGADGYRAVN